MTNAFFFGSADKRLFGVYHEPSLGRDRQSGIVLCYPFGQEYIRSHRSYQKLAVQLAGAGFHVLRFDYYGCGDSSGGSQDGTIDQWLDDIVAAVIEIKDSAGIEEVSLVGLRLGATLAARASTREASAQVKNLVLWEPVTNGKRYVAEQLRDHRNWLRDLSLNPPRGRRPSTGTELLGFPLSDRLRDEIESIDLLSSTEQKVSRALLIENDDLAGLAEFSDHMQKLGVECENQRIAAPRVWLNQAGPDLALVPNDSLRCITSWIDKVHR